MQRARSLLRDNQHFVEDGREFVGKVKMRDSMHFVRESTQAVVAMLFQAVKGGLRKLTCEHRRGHVLVHEALAAIPSVARGVEHDIGSTGCAVKTSWKPTAPGDVT